MNKLNGADQLNVLDTSIRYLQGINESLVRVLEWLRKPESSGNALLEGEPQRKKRAPRRHSLVDTLSKQVLPGDRRRIKRLAELHRYT